MIDARQDQIDGLRAEVDALKQVVDSVKRGVEKSKSTIVIREASGQDGTLDYVVQGVRAGFADYEVVRDRTDAMPKLGSPRLGTGAAVPPPPPAKIPVNIPSKPVSNPIE